MGGQLGVESNVQADGTVFGSTFWFLIPLRVAEAPVLPSEATQQILENIDYQGNVHVLLVDDNEINQRLASVMLQNIGCQVTIAGNGLEAIHKLKGNDFQLILMDIQMPLMNGYETTEHIRGKLKLVLPIIGLSANVYKEEIEQCYHSGMNDYLGKPYTERKLREKIVKWAPVYIKEEQATEEIGLNRGGKLTDLSFLVELFNDDQDSINEMVSDFITQQQQLMADMDAALRSGNYQQISDISHNMRSSIAAVGLEALREPLLALEVLAKAGDNHEAIAAQLAEVQNINGAAINELNVS
jgi:CheY-like chemotaxis protein